MYFIGKFREDEKTFLRCYRPPYEVEVAIVLHDGLRPQFP